MRREIIGDAELWLGDCRDVLPTLEEKAAVVVCDPPYSVTQTSVTHYTRPNMIRGGWMSADYPVKGQMFEIPPPETWARVVFDACADDADAYFMTNDRHLPAFSLAYAAAGWRYHNTLVWRKPTGIPNRWYFKDVEFTLYLFKGKAKTIRIPASTCVFDCEHPRERIHPSEKPVRLLSHYVLNSSDPGDLVLDPFMGSGATGVAALENYRRFVGVECDDKHFSAACRRFEKLATAPRLDLPPAPAKQTDFFSEGFPQ